MEVDITRKTPYFIGNKGCLWTNDLCLLRLLKRVKPGAENSEKNGLRV